MNDLAAETPRSSTFRKSYRKLTGAEIALVEDLKTAADDLEHLILSASYSRHQSLALTRLEECVMWATKGITT